MAFSLLLPVVGLWMAAAVQEPAPGWAFRPVQRPDVPGGSSHPIDAFIGARLEAAGLAPAGPASPREFLRRATLDLVGLPPTPEEQDAFLGDTAPDAGERLIDRLLASPAYGERWARHWLDVVRYADSNGYEIDGAKPGVWKYRDYVIDAFNRDTPYDRFVLEQVAGDELEDPGVERFIAMGFWALGPWQAEVDPLEAPQYRADELDDLVSTVSQAFLGISLGCARCHDHRYDPLTMKDYYGMVAIVEPLRRPNEGRTDRDRPVGTPAEREAQDRRDREIADLGKRIEALRAGVRERWIASGRSGLPPAVAAAFAAPPAERTAEQQEQVKKHEDEWEREVREAMPPETRSALEELEAAGRARREKTPDLPRGYVLFEPPGDPPKTVLLHRGNPAVRGPEVSPAVPAVLAPRPPEFLPPDRHTSRRRLSLARWIASPDNPLTARVIVNRVWQHHFGRGLVATPSEFGRQGAPPTHPELLDWLASWFVAEGGWSIKRLHRLIMTSAAYRRSSRGGPRDRDPENRLLGRFPYQRLDAEAIRDSMLAVSGEIDAQRHGPPVQFHIPDIVIEAHTDKHAAWTNSSDREASRRTIYGFVKRTLPVPMLDVLDFCDTSRSTAQRATTTVAPQALTLLNGHFVNLQAERFAARIKREAGAEPAARIERAFRLALARSPTPSEMAGLEAFLREGATTRQMCRVILNLNEFVYVD